MRELDLSAISEDLALPAAGETGRIWSIHNDYVNCKTEGALISLVCSGMPHIPFGIEVDLPEGWLHAGLAQHQPVIFDTNAVRIGDVFAIRGLYGTPRFSCQPRIISPVCKGELMGRLQQLLQLCLETAAIGGIDSYIGRYDAAWFFGNKDTGAETVAASKAPSFRGLVRGVKERNKLLIGEGVKGLLGVGPGATPSGDDFLIGFYSGISYCGDESDSSSAEMMARHMTDNANELTTSLSVEYIKYGVKRRYHQKVGQMISAFRTGTMQELVCRGRELMSLGHTSGADLLYGFIYGGFTDISITAGADEFGGVDENL